MHNVCFLIFLATFLKEISVLRFLILKWTAIVWISLLVLILVLEGIRCLELVEQE